MAHMLILLGFSSFLGPYPRLKPRRADFAIDENVAKGHICATAADTLHLEVARMARRGSNSFKRNDGIRALRVARDGGMEPGALEVVVAPDGTVTFRVLGEKVAGLMGLAPETAADARDWQDEIAALKGKAPKGKGR
jgi:hypothetical protein